MTEARSTRSVGRWGWPVFWLGVANCLALPISVGSMGKANVLFLVFFVSLLVGFTGGLIYLIMRWKSRYAADELGFFFAPYCLASVLALGAIAIVTAATLEISNVAPSAPAWLSGALFALFLSLLAIAIRRRLRSG